MIDLDELERLEKAATPGCWEPVMQPLAPDRPWRLGRIVEHQAQPLREKADAELGCALRNAAPQLIALARTAAELAKALRWQINEHACCANEPCTEKALAAFDRAAEGVIGR